MRPTLPPDANRHILSVTAEDEADHVRKPPPPHGRRSEEKGQRAVFQTKRFF